MDLFYNRFWSEFLVNRLIVGGQKPPNFIQNIFMLNERIMAFGTPWGWVNDDRIFIFGWTIFSLVPIISQENNAETQKQHKWRGGA